MDWLLVLGTSVLGGLIAGAILAIVKPIAKLVLKGELLQAWREHGVTAITSVDRLSVIAFAVAGLFVAIVVALWSVNDDARPTEPQEQAADAMPQEQAADAMPQEQAADAMPQEQAADTEPQEQAADTEPQEQAPRASTSSPLSPTEKREVLAEALFAGRGDLKQGVMLFPHDHLYGADDPDPQADPEEPRCGYRGGHAGWHVRAERVDGDRVGDDLEFYSLTAGTVIAVNHSKAYNEIAVHSKREGDETGHTVLYAHARQVLVTEGDPVEVGDKLGVQGQAGLTGLDRVVHVHIEVRADGLDGAKQTRLACGKPGSINPTEYLYRTWVDEREQ